MKKCYLFICFAVLSIHTFANELKLTGVYPTNWWIGMKNRNLQLMLHGENVAAHTFTITNPGVKLLKIHKPENKNYVFLDLLILPAAKPGMVKINYVN
ncbi:MAG TPA: cyclomaltodextrinase N-terminal domain-containing protein, partial [Flavisolibacter sp.]|nr:cyclomaltodextrinase N-terminal domain-containing protein [Flavisolibacter sp.]